MQSGYHQDANSHGVDTLVTLLLCVGIIGVALLLTGMGISWGIWFAIPVVLLIAYAKVHRDQREARIRDRSLSGHGHHHAH
jgi:hypothetical protein